MCAKTQARAMAAGGYVASNGSGEPEFGPAAASAGSPDVLCEAVTAALRLPPEEREVAVPAAVATMLGQSPKCDEANSLLGVLEACLANPVRGQIFTHYVHIRTCYSIVIMES